MQANGEMVCEHSCFIHKKKYYINTKELSLSPQLKFSIENFDQISIRVCFFFRNRTFLWFSMEHHKTAKLDAKIDLP